MAASTWELGRSIYESKIAPHPIGLKPVNEIGYEDIEAWARELQTKPVIRNEKTIVPARPMASTSRFRYMSFLSGIFDRAIKAGLIQSNPVKIADHYPNTPKENSFRVLSPKEVEELIDIVRKWQVTFFENRPKFRRSLPEGIERRAMLIVLLGLHGLGPAEMAGAKREDFDGEGFDVTEQAQRGELMKRLKTKNRRGRVWLDMDGLLADEIRKAPPGLLLATSKGTPMWERNIRRMFEGIVAGTKFEGMTPYDLRHTFAMRLLEEGAELVTVAALMRNTPEVVLRRYVKSRDESQREAIKKLKYGKRGHTRTPDRTRSADAS